jgi:hypothetical protein
MHLNDQPYWVRSALLDAEVQSRAIDYMDDRYRAIVLKGERQTKEEDAFMGAYMTIRTVLELSSVSKYERLCHLVVERGQRLGKQEVSKFLDPSRSVLSASQNARLAEIASPFSSRLQQVRKVFYDFVRPQLLIALGAHLP